MKTKTLKVTNFQKTFYRTVPAIGEKVVFDGKVENIADKSFKGIPSGTFCEVVDYDQNRGQVYIKVKNPIDEKIYEIEIHKLHYSIIQALKPKKIYLKHKFGDKL